MYTIIGDANVRRNMTGLNMASREAMKTAEIIDCTLMSNLDASLNAVRAESTILILASITEFLLSSGDCGTIFSSIDPVLASLSAKLNGFSTFRPGLQVRSLLALLLLAYHFAIRLRY